MNPIRSEIMLFPLNQSWLHFREHETYQNHNDVMEAVSNAVSAAIGEDRSTVWERVLVNESLN